MKFFLEKKKKKEKNKNSALKTEWKIDKIFWKPWRFYTIHSQFPSSLTISALCNNRSERQIKLNRKRFRTMFEKHSIILDACFELSINFSDCICFWFCLRSIQNALFWNIQSEWILCEHCTHFEKELIDFLPLD